MSYLVPTVIESSPRGERAYDIYSRLLKDRIVMLGSQVDDNVAAADLDVDPDIFRAMDDILAPVAPFEPYTS